MICRMKRRLASSSSLARTSPGRRVASILRRDVLMRLFGRRQIAKQLADGGVARAARRLLIEPGGVLLHLPRLAAHDIDPERPQLPDRATLHPAAHILPANERNVIAEFLDVEIDQLTAMLALLGRHIGEDMRAGGIIVPQALGEVGVDAPVLLFAADRQRKNLAFAEVGEASASSSLLPDFAEISSRGLLSRRCGDRYIRP